MGIDRHHRINRTAAELLLSGDPTVSGDLADLLGAAAAPAPAGTVVGEDAAMAAFRAVQGEPARRRHRASLRLATAARWLTTKIAVLAVVVLGAGGVAVAATTGVLPNPLRTHPATAPGPGRTSQRPTPAPAPTSPGRPGPSPTGPATTVSASAVSASADLHGLCTAYTAQLAAGHSLVLDNPAFRPLIAAAGGESQVAAYCAAMDAAPSAGTTAAGHPGAAPTTHPTGKPSTLPAGGSGNHPTGRPSSIPGNPPSSHPGR